VSRFVDVGALEISRVLAPEPDEKMRQNAESGALCFTFLIVVGILLWLVNTHIPMNGKIK
jgi:hypothetical protein